MEGKPDTEDAMRVLIEGAMAEATHQCCRNSEKGEMGGRWGRGGRFWKATVARARRETGWWVTVAWRGEATSLGPGMLDPTAWRSVLGRLQQPHLHPSQCKGHSDTGFSNLC